MKLQDVFNDKILGTPNQELLTNSNFGQLLPSLTSEVLITTEVDKLLNQQTTLETSFSLDSETSGGETKTAQNTLTSPDVLPSASLPTNPTTAFAVGGNVLQVTTTADENDGDQGTGLSLRDAILEANQNPEQHYKIILQGGETYTLSIDGSRERNAITGDLDIQGNVTIETLGEQPAIIDASSFSPGSRDRVFDVLFGSQIELKGLKITGGEESTSKGGGIRSNGFLKTNGVTISGNIGNQGGGIAIVQGEAEIVNTHIENNQATGIANSGGGLYVDRATTAIIRDS